VGVTFNTVSVRTSHTKPVGRNSRFLIRIHAKFCHVFSVMRHETVRSAIHSFLGITAPVRNLTVGKWARGIMDLERATKRCKVTTVYMVLIRRWGGGGGDKWIVDLKPELWICFPIIVNNYLFTAENI
jgi:hypothetical protein